VHAPDRLRHRAPSNLERYFEARDSWNDLIGFYYFEPKPPDLDYGLGLRPDLTGRGLGLDFFLAGLAFHASATARGVSFAMWLSSMNQPAMYMSAAALAWSRAHMRAAVWPSLPECHPTREPSLPSASVRESHLSLSFVRRRR